jgi:hypothetical protein
VRQSWVTDFIIKQQMQSLRDEEFDDKVYEV